MRTLFFLKSIAVAIPCELNVVCMNPVIVVLALLPFGDAWFRDCWEISSPVLCVRVRGGVIEAYVSWTGRRWKKWWQLLL